MTLRQRQLRVRKLISNRSGKEKLNRDLDVPIAVWGESAKDSRSGGRVKSAVKIKKSAKPVKI